MSDLLTTAKQTRDAERGAEVYIESSMHSSIPDPFISSLAAADDELASIPFCSTFRADFYVTPSDARPRPPPTFHFFLADYVLLAHGRQFGPEDGNKDDEKLSFRFFIVYLETFERYTPVRLSVPRLHISLAHI